MNMIVSDRTRSILQELEQVREDLLALSDDIWLNIDHNDNEALAEGCRFKADYNEKMARLDQAAGELSELVQQFTQIKLEAEPVNPDTLTAAATERIVRELDSHEVHSLDEDFMFKRPHGFRLGDESQSGIVTWRGLYELVCLHLQRRDADRFRLLPQNPAFVSRRGNPGFSPDRAELRSAMELPDGVFAEVNLSANSIRDQIKLLLKEFGIKREDLRIYLRQDRDADG